MNALSFIQQAAAEGVRLAVSDSGNVKVNGEAAIVNRWLPAIREHKVEILAALKDAANVTSIKSCRSCLHAARPGLDNLYCGGRDDLPKAYGQYHPLRQFPDDGGATCDCWEARISDEGGSHAET